MLHFSFYLFKDFKTGVDGCRSAAADFSFMTTHSGIQVTVITVCVIMHWTVCLCECDLLIFQFHLCVMSYFIHPVCFCYSDFTVFTELLKKLRFINQNIFLAFKGFCVCFLSVWSVSAEGNMNIPNIQKYNPNQIGENYPLQFQEPKRVSLYVKFCPPNSPKTKHF